MNAVIYCRVAATKQTSDSESIESQEKLCRELASKKGYEISKENVFVDIGQSGNKWNRPAFRKLLKKCKKDKTIKALFASNVDRLTRNFSDYSKLIKKTEKMGIKIFYVQESLSTFLIDMFRNINIYYSGLNQK